MGENLKTGPNTVPDGFHSSAVVRVLLSSTVWQTFRAHHLLLSLTL